MSKWKEMAERTTILRCLVGSQAYGLSLGKSDRDERGVCIEDYEAAFNLTGEYEQFEFRSAVEQTGKKDAKSEAGDLDLTIYSLRKFLRLALGGNPNILEMLFIRGDNTIKWERLGTELQDLYPLIVSRRAGGAYLGYIKGQRNRYFKSDGDGARQELIEKWGYDIKAASHVIRLCYQGIELLQTGKIVMPLSGTPLEQCLAIKKGEWPLAAVNAVVIFLEDILKELLDSSPLQAVPDTAAIEDWCQRTYWTQWGLRSPKLLLAPESEYVH